MNTPKNPDNTAASALDEKIDELEDLLETPPTETVEPPKQQSLNIPVLEELVDYRQESVLRNVPPKRQEEYLTEEQISDEKLSNLLDQVEDRINDELDSLVSMLKENIKDSLMSEIKNQLSAENKIETNKPEDDQEI